MIPAPKNSPTKEDIDYAARVIDDSGDTFRPLDFRTSLVLRRMVMRAYADGRASVNASATSGKAQGFPKWWKDFLRDDPQAEPRDKRMIHAAWLAAVRATEAKYEERERLVFILMATAQAACVYRGRDLPPSVDDALDDLRSTLSALSALSHKSAGDAGGVNS